MGQTAGLTEITVTVDRLTDGLRTRYFQVRQQDITSLRAGG